MNYGYIRVSTDMQTVKNQKIAIREYAKSHRIRNIVWCSETISGTKRIEKRKLGELISKVEEGDVIVITELSRLGRSMLMILEVLQILLEKNVKVISIKEGFVLADNMQTKILAFAFGLCAELERTLLSQRTKEGLERARREGKQIGRRVGQHPKRYKLTGKGAYIRRERGKGRSVQSLADELGVDRTTVKSFMVRNKIR